MKKRFTLVDYAIIILVICAVVFAFIHITSDDDSARESTSYDSSTLNKIVEKYLTYYRQGFIVDTTIHGFNSSDGKPVTLEGNIKWMDDDRGSNVKGLVNCNGTDYIVGLYNHVPNADIYLDSMTLEMNGEKYSNLTEIKVNPENITSINDLISELPENATYEITTTISVDSVETTTFQEINNLLFQNNERISVKATNTGYTDQISIIRATDTELSQVSPIIGEFNGITGQITIRLYNCSDSDIDTIENNFDVINIQKF
ncbi:MAG: adhesin [Methanobrevibacter sp.]|uniref:adhesin n=1 Tax=Methanobrevibacter sp. TaxID=66852 RepID=UPI0025E48DFC|nr:adhesin [Methanobrevibacter sp.]MBR0270761.1 adhesin [Methanobrevibacter sp.]